jgi:hypothetical protein
MEAHEDALPVEVEVIVRHDAPVLPGAQEVAEALGHTFDARPSPGEGRRHRRIAIPGAPTPPTQSRLVPRHRRSSARAPGSPRASLKATSRTLQALSGLSVIRSSGPTSHAADCTHLSGVTSTDVHTPLGLLIASAGALGMVACGSDIPATTAKQSKMSGTTPAAVAFLASRPQEAVLRLPAGRSTSRFEITAVPHDEWDLRVSAPAKADLSVEALKPDGERLYLLETTRQRYPCAVTGGRSHCFLRFAIGANLAPGTWTIIATKRTEPAATARIQVTFHRPASR